MYVYKENSFMRKIITNIMLISGFLMVGNVATSCGKVEDLIDDISVPIPFTIPVNLDAQIPFATVNTTDFVTYPEIPVNLDLDAKIKEEYPSFSINNLKSVKLDNFSIIYVSSTGGTKLDAIKDAELYLKTPDTAAKLIATTSGNVNPTTLSFTPVANLDLIADLKSKQNSFILKIRGSKVAVDVMKIRVTSGFKIEVGF